MLDVWLVIVRRLTKSASAICWSVSPSASNRSISNSRRENPLGSLTRLTGIEPGSGVKARASAVAASGVRAHPSDQAAVKASSPRAARAART